MEPQRTQPVFSIDTADAIVDLAVEVLIARGVRGDTPAERMARWIVARLGAVDFDRFEAVRGEIYLDVSNTFASPSETRSIATGLLHAADAVDAEHY